jgi:hypothetical protein
MSGLLRSQFTAVQEEGTPVLKEKERVHQAFLSHRRRLYIPEKKG